jgi:hypothetical protein
MSRTTIQPTGAANEPVAETTFRSLKRTCGQIGRGCLLAIVWVIRVGLILGVLATFAQRSFAALFIMLILVGIAFAVIRTRLVSFRLFLNRSIPC